MNLEELSYYTYGFHMWVDKESESFIIWVDEGNPDVTKEDIEAYYNRIKAVLTVFNYSLKEFPAIEEILDIVHNYWGTAWLYSLTKHSMTVIPLGELDEDCEEENV